jgi:hypothetical protein
VAAAAKRSSGITRWRICGDARPSRAPLRLAHEFARALDAMKATLDIDPASRGAWNYGLTAYESIERFDEAINARAQLAQPQELLLALRNRNRRAGRPLPANRFCVRTGQMPTENPVEHGGLPMQTKEHRCGGKYLRRCDLVCVDVSC